MLKIVASVNNRETLFLGLDRENTTRLHEGKPIVVDAQALTAQLKHGPIQDVVLCAGETLDDIHAELSQYIPLPPMAGGTRWDAPWGEGDHD